MKKKISVTFDHTMDERITNKVKELGISKSAFIAFSTSFFLNQLEYIEKHSGSKGIYEIIRQNYEDAIE